MVMSLVRVKESDIWRVYEVVKGVVFFCLYVFLVMSDIYMKYKFCMLKEDVLNSIYCLVMFGKLLFLIV